ncbi:MAG: phosphoenolpyruvate--protein phosphotransferase [Firmicutes bacterium]|nr:phosphoenolpyruvate--protein phosphotransferase [Bacillota bacterium]
MYKGVPASPGIAMGKALVLPKKHRIVKRRIIQDPETEKKRFLEAVEEAKGRIESIMLPSGESAQEVTLEILEAHQLILEDPELINAVTSQIGNEKINAEFALEATLNFYIDLLAKSDSPYMRERITDIRDVGNHVLDFLLGEETFRGSMIKEECIIVSTELTPSDTAQLPPDRVLGFITELGGPTSHAAIIARSMEIPAVVGLADITNAVRNDDYLIVDGEHGAVFLNPDSETIQEYRIIQEDKARQRRELIRIKDSPAQTKDGSRIKLLANVGEPWELAKAVEYGAEGIGLFRTEYLFMNRESLPSEEEQYQSYKEALERMDGNEVVIRTLDIGGDKKLPYLSLGDEMNPFLGYRAIRLCLKERELFRTQLRALYRASPHGNLKIMFPMISNLDEYRDARSLAREVKSELIKEGHIVREDVPVGIMVEIPSTAIISDLFAKEVDFFSIGTNDLIQYTLAVDRMNEQVSSLYDPFHPAVLRLIKMVIDHARKEGIPCSMCGEMAGDPRFTQILIGFGLNSFSMSPSSLLRVKKTLFGLDLENSRSLAKKILELPTSSDIKDCLMIEE